MSHTPTRYPQSKSVWLAGFLGLMGLIFTACLGSGTLGTGLSSPSADKDRIFEEDDNGYDDGGYEKGLDEGGDPSGEDEGPGDLLIEGERDFVDPVTDSMVGDSGFDCNTVVTCISDDGCCPVSCNAKNDSDCAPTCPNNVAEPGEECDGPDLGGQTCSTLDLGYVAGELSCNSNCTWQVTNCIADPIIVYDIRHLATDFHVQSVRGDIYDRMLAIQTLQGLVNRDKPRLFLNFVEGYENFNMTPGGPTILFDQTWFNKMCAPASFTVCNSAYTALNGRAILRFNEATLPVANLVANYFFDGFVNGIVTWDPQVAATSNAAVSIAGGLGLIAARCQTDSGTVLERLLAETDLGVEEDLCALNFLDKSRIPEYPGLASTQSRKNNVYVWLVEKYLKTRILNPDRFGYYVDAFVVENRFAESLYVTGTSHFDWAVRNKALVFDLSVWGDEVACDERDLSPPVGVDKQTFNYILSTANSLSTNLKYVDGFVPWVWKYTDYQSCGSHFIWHTEHEEVNLFSENGVVFANTDAESELSPKAIGVMPNASFYSHLTSTAKRRFLNNTQNPPPTPAQAPLENKTYILFGLGDYDSAAWAYKMLLSSNLWRNSERGTVPLFWELNPVIFESNPVLLDEILATKTATDFFGALEGYGYNNANLFSRKALLQTQTQKAYDRLNYSHTAFYIFTEVATRGTDGTLSTAARDFLMSFSGDALGAADSPAYGHNTLFTSGINDQSGVPYSEAHVYLPPPDGACTTISCRANYINSAVPASTPQFAFVRTVFISPAQIKALMTELQTNYNTGRNWQIVSPYTYYYLLRQHLGKNNFYRTTYLADNFPSRAVRQVPQNITVTVRNDGWDTWVAGVYALGWSLVPEGQAHSYTTYNNRGWVALPYNVAPLQSVNLSFVWTVNDPVGRYWLQIDMLNNGTNNTWFREQHDNPWNAVVEVVAN